MYMRILNALWTINIMIVEIYCLEQFRCTLNFSMEGRYAEHIVNYKEMIQSKGTCKGEEVFLYLNFLRGTVLLPLVGF